MKKSLDFDLEVSLYQIATLALSSSSVVVRKYDTDKLTSKDTKPTNAIIFNGDTKECRGAGNNQTNKLTYKHIDTPKGILEGTYINIWIYL